MALKKEYYQMMNMNKMDSESVWPGFTQLKILHRSGARRSPTNQLYRLLLSPRRARERERVELELFFLALQSEIVEYINA